MTERLPVDGRPRPMVWRARAWSLDGAWDFATDAEGRWDAPEDVRWTETIVVPFAPGTPASGLHGPVEGSVWWYRRHATFDADGADEQVLHFGAIDHDADIWVDGRHVASHEGGYTPIRVHLRGRLASSGVHEIVVRAGDDPADLSKPRGKQTWEAEPRAIWYPRTVGIWQPVWTERVHTSHVDDVAWRADVKRSTITVQLRLRAPERDQRVHLRLTAPDGSVVADDSWAVTGPVLERSIVLDRGAGELEARDLVWSPRRPVLFDATIRLLDGAGEVLDEVESYTALRSVGTDGTRLLLNDRPVRHRLVLDQGYWPESGLTAPSDDALRRDVELTKQLGFNGVRKHQKVEDPRYLYWADRLGLMVWAELPSAYRFDERAVQRALRMWPEVVLRDRSHPCIVGWVTFNESWGVREIAARPDQQAYVSAVANLTRAVDTTRPVIANDGWESVDGDVVAIHDYDLNAERLTRRWSEELADQLDGYGPNARRLVLRGPDGGSPVLLSEFGGISLGADGWGYGKAEDEATFLAQFEALLRAVRASPHLAGFCYTQLTDTYQETNGLLTFDRRPKADLARMRAAVRGRADGPSLWDQAHDASS